MLLWFIIGSALAVLAIVAASRIPDLVAFLYVAFLTVSAWLLLVLIPSAQVAVEQHEVAAESVQVLPAFASRIVLIDGDVHEVDRLADILRVDSAQFRAVRIYGLSFWGDTVSVETGIIFE